MFCDFDSGFEGQGGYWKELKFVSKFVVFNNAFKCSKPLLDENLPVEIKYPILDVWEIVL